MANISSFIFAYHNNIQFALHSSSIIEMYNFVSGKFQKHFLTLLGSADL